MNDELDSKVITHQSAQVVNSKTSEACQVQEISFSPHLQHFLPHVFPNPFWSQTFWVSARPSKRPPWWPATPPTPCRPQRLRTWRRRWRRCCWGSWRPWRGARRPSLGRFGWREVFWPDKNIQKPWKKPKGRMLFDTSHQKKEPFFFEDFFQIRPAHGPRKKTTRCDRFWLKGHFFFF